MIDFIDGPKGKDDWAIADWEKETITYDESNITKPITCSDIVFTRGKYAGSFLNEIDNTWYLKFIRDKNPDDYFISYAFNKRIKELE